MRKFSKKAQHFAMLICGIICVANIFIACNKNDDDYTETDEVTKRLTHFSISSNRADYDYDNATFYYEYDELDRIVAVKGQTTFQFSYIGDSNVPENLRIIENTNRPNRYEDHKVIYNENGIPVQVQKTGTYGNDYVINISYKNGQLVLSETGDTYAVIEDPDLEKGTFSKYKLYNTSYSYHYALNLKNGIKQQQNLDLFMVLISPNLIYLKSYLIGYFFSPNIVIQLDKTPSPTTERIEIEKTNDGYISKRKFIERGGNIYTTDYFYE